MISNILAVFTCQSPFSAVAIQHGCMLNSYSPNLLYSKPLTFVLLLYDQHMQEDR